MVRKINDVVVYRVGELDWVHGSFFTDSLDYYDHSSTGYRKEDAKPYVLDLADAKVFDPIEEWGLSVEGWNDMRQTEEFFNSRGLDGYEYLDGVDYDDPDSYHEVMADADVLAAWAREHDYDAVIFRDVPTAGYGPSFTEYCVFNKDLVKPADLVERIVKKGSKWQVQSEDGSKNLGTYDTKAEAEKRLRQVHYFKHIKESEEKMPGAEDIVLTDDLYRIKDMVSNGKSWKLVRVDLYGDEAWLICPALGEFTHEDMLDIAISGGYVPDDVSNDFDNCVILMAIPGSADAGMGWDALVDYDDATQYEYDGVKIVDLRKGNVDSFDDTLLARAFGSQKSVRHYSGIISEDVKVATADIKGAEFSGSEPELVGTYASVLPHADWKAGTVSYKYALTQDQAEDLRDFLSNAPQARTLNLRLGSLWDAVEAAGEAVLYVLFHVFNNRVRSMTYRLYANMSWMFDIANINVEKPDATYNSDPEANMVIGLGVDEILGLDYCQMGQAVIDDVLNRFNAEYRRIHHIDEDVKISQADDTGAKFIGSKPELVGEFISSLPPYDGQRIGSIAYVYKLTDEQARAVVGFVSKAEPDMERWLNEFMSEATWEGSSVGLSAYFSVLGDAVNADYRLTSDGHILSLLDVRMTDVGLDLRPNPLRMSGITKNSLKIGMGIDIILGLSHFSDGPSVILDKLMAEYKRKGYSTEESDALSEDVSVMPADIRAEFVGSKPELIDSIAFAYPTPSGGKRGQVTHAYVLTDEHVSALVEFLEGFNASMASSVRHFRKNFSMPGRPLLLTADLGVTEKGISTLWYELSSPDRRWVMGLGSVHVSGHEYLRPADTDDETLTDDVNEAAICMAIDKMFGLDYVRPSAATLETVMAEFEDEYQRKHPLGEDVHIKSYAAHQRPFMYERRNNKESGDTHELWELPPDCVNTLADMLEDVDEGYGGLPTLLRHLADAGDSVTLAIDDYGDDDLIQYTLLAGGGNFILVYLPKDDLANGMKGYGDSEPVREAKLIRVLDDVFGFGVIGRFLKDAHIDEDVSISASANRPPLLSRSVSPGGISSYVYDLSEPEMLALARVVRDHEGDVSLYTTASVGYIAKKISKGGDFVARLHIVTYDLERGDASVSYRLDTSDSDGPIDSMTIAQCGGKKGNGTMEDDGQAGVMFDIDAALGISHATKLFRRGKEPAEEGLDEDVDISASGDALTLLRDGKGADGGHWWTYGINDPAALRMLIRFAPSYERSITQAADRFDEDRDRYPTLSVRANAGFIYYELSYPSPSASVPYNTVLMYITAPAAEDHTDVRKALTMERALGISHLPEWLSADGTLAEPDAMEDDSWKDGSWKRFHSEDDEDSVPLSMAERYVMLDADEFEWSIRVKGEDGKWLYGRDYDLDDQRLNGYMTLSQAYWLLPKAAEAGEADIVIDVAYNDDQVCSIMTMRRGG